MALNLTAWASRVRVADGAWGTELQRRGLPPGSPPELWNAERPDAVAEVARGYLDAGADVILTNTFGANRFVLDAHGAGGRVGPLAAAGAALSRQAAGDEKPVFASLGPTGKIVMSGDVPGEAIAAAYAEAAAALVQAGLDAVLLESFAELDEIALALDGVRRATDLPVILSMSFGAGPDGARTIMGTSPEDAARLAEARGAAAVGGNCGCGPESYVQVARRYRAATDLPIWIKPNAGLPKVVEGRTVFPMGPEAFAAFAAPLIEAGANILGGCCGTGPDHIRALRAAVDDRAARGKG
jgi:methionine synthase I (cobalamin-dependent)